MHVNGAVRQSLECAEIMEHLWTCLVTYGSHCSVMVGSFGLEIYDLSGSIKSFHYTSFSQAGQKIISVIYEKKTSSKCSKQLGKVMFTKIQFAHINILYSPCLSYF